MENIITDVIGQKVNVGDYIVWSHKDEAALYGGFVTKISKGKQIVTICTTQDKRLRKTNLRVNESGQCRSGRFIKITKLLS